MMHFNDFYGFIIESDAQAKLFDRQMLGWVLQMTNPADAFSYAACQLSCVKFTPDEEVARWIKDNIIIDVNALGEISAITPWFTPGYYEDGLGNIYDEDTPHAMVEFQYELAVKNTSTIPEEYRQTVLEMGPAKNKAALSVMFKFKSPIPDYVLEVLVNRAKEFNYKTFDIPPVNIKGYKLLTRTFNDSYTDI